MLKHIQIFIQYLVPQAALSRFAGKLANCEKPLFKNILIKCFSKRYNVNTSEMDREITEYRSLNDFFTRKLKPGSRQINFNPTSIISPSDGVISQIDSINNNMMIQAKNHNYSLEDLLVCKSSTNAFVDGHYATIYLSPKDYHRVHMPFSGKLKKMIYVPGKLFSVNKITADNVPRLFAKNERVVCIFETEIGQMAVIFIGAMIVAGIHTVFSGKITPSNSSVISRYHYGSSGVFLERGQELGHFEAGSTVITLFEKNRIKWNSDIVPGNAVRMGNTIGEFLIHK